MNKELIPFVDSYASEMKSIIKEYPSLFKYRYFDLKDYHVNILENLEIYFSSVDKLNDPFDCNINYSYKDLTDHEIKVFVKGHSELFGKRSFSKSEIKIGTKNFKKNLFNKSFEHSYNDLVYERKKNDLGIFSLSYVNNDIKMWSYYCDSHKGFCIEFNTLNLFKCLGTLSLRLSKKLKKYDYLIAPVKIEYSNEYPEINPIKEFENRATLFLKILKTKSIEWSSEKEIRFIFLGGANTPVKLEPNCIQSVYLGNKIEVKNKNRIIEILRKHRNNGYQIKLHTSKLLENKYGLTYEEIEY